MLEFKPPRPGEQKIVLPTPSDANLIFIGRIHTPWKTPADCPKNSAARADVEATIEIDEPFVDGLHEIELFSHLIALYWLHLSRRDLIKQCPSHLDHARGTFALRSPVRPNPIGLSIVKLLKVDGQRLTVRNIDCVNGTPLIDLKPYFASIDSYPEATRP